MSDATKETIIVAALCAGLATASAIAGFLYGQKQLKIDLVKSGAAIWSPTEHEKIYINGVTK